MDKDKGNLPVPEIVKKEYALLWQDQRTLIRCDHPLCEEDVRAAVQIARIYSVPVSAVAAVPSGGGFKHYMTVEGLLWQLHNDPRGLESIEPEVIQWADDQNGCTAKAKCTITLGGGKRFVGYCQHSRGRGAGEGVSADDITNKCIDIAVSRTCVMAAGITVPIYEGE